MTDDAPAGTPDDPRNDPLPRPVCRSTTKAGRPCRNHAAAGSAYCGAHGGGAGKVGAPRKLTPDTRDTIVRAIEDGCTLAIAARAAGIHPDTFLVWREQGAADVAAGVVSDYAELSVALHDAQARAELTLIRMIRAAGKDDWRAAMALLERRFPERWSRRTAVDVTSAEVSKPRTVVPEQSQADRIVAMLRAGMAPPSDAQ